MFGERFQRLSRGRQVIWFMVGFALAIVLVLLVWDPLAALLPAGTPPTATPTIPSPTAVPTATVPAPTAYGLVWTATQALTGDCAQLTLDESDQGAFGPCGGTASLAPLSESEMVDYLRYVMRLGSFEYQIAASDAARGQSVRLRFGGRGPQTASLEQQAEVARWAEGVHQRMSQAAQETWLTWLAQADLAAQLGLATEQVQLLDRSAVMWPDACLGVPSGGLACAQTVTPGYLILLRVQGAVYEYHTDLRGRVRLASSEPTNTPVPAPVTPTPPLERATLLPTALPSPTWAPLVITDWLGEYYANRDLAGEPVVRRNDREVDFYWAGGAPAEGLPIDQFSVRWGRVVPFVEGTYRFTLRADDGVRLWLAGNPLIDRWVDGYAEQTVDTYVMTGELPLVVEYYEAGGLAEVHLDWLRLVQPTPAPTPWPDPPTGEWRGAYYANRDLQGDPLLVRNDRWLDFDWGKGHPASGLPDDGFSVRWVRRLYLDEGAYRLSMTADDGCRVWVDGQLLIDQWHDSVARTYTEQLYLPAGYHDLRIDYYEAAGQAVARLVYEKVTAFPHWRGEYYANDSLAGYPVVVRDDPTISFDWGEGAPAPLLPADRFSARWTRVITLNGGSYQFDATADDGVRLWVDQTLLIDAWNGPAGRRQQRQTVLGGGAHALLVEYREIKGSARINMSWQPLNEPPR